MCLVSVGYTLVVCSHFLYSDITSHRSHGRYVSHGNVETVSRKTLGTAHSEI